MANSRSQNDKPPLPGAFIVRLTLRAMPSDVPAQIRLRAVLKRLLRSYQFRCELVEYLSEGVVDPNTADTAAS